MKPLTLVIATAAIALPLLEPQGAQAQTTQLSKSQDKSASESPSKSQVSRNRDRTLRYQNAKKRTRYNTTAMKPMPPQPMQARPSAPQPLQPLPVLAPGPVRTTYVYLSPTYRTPFGSDRPICFIERSDGSFMDLSKLCGMKSNTDLNNPNFNTSSNPMMNGNNASMPSYPIYPEDRQPQ